MSDKCTQISVYNTRMTKPKSKAILKEIQGEDRIRNKTSTFENMDHK